ncbi:MAG: ribonuclease H-like domain-containing protein [Anaerovoracaceae bacterium]
MEYIRKQLNYTKYKSNAFEFYFKGMTIGALDIETTGLSPQNNKFILGGLAVAEKDSLILHQFFAENIDEEKQVLTDYINEVSNLDLILTYNGKNFDIPFMKKRGSGFCSEFPFNLDLYQIIRTSSNLKAYLPNLRQKTVENFMGFWDQRKDEISGRDSVDLYYRYMNTKDPTLKEQILLHNSDDVLQLYRLLTVLGKCDLHQALFQIGFPLIFNDGMSLLVNEVVLKNRGPLVVHGIQTGTPVNYISYVDENHPYSATFNKENRLFKVSVPLIHKYGLTMVDFTALDLPTAPVEKYPFFGNGLLILANQGEKNYLETNHFIKLLLERICKR